MIEKVNLKHIDKKCDYLADVLHDFYLDRDSGSYTSIDILYNSGSYNIYGQVSSNYSASLIELKQHLSFLECYGDFSKQKSIDIFNLNLGTFSSQSLYYLDNNFASDSCVSVGYATTGSGEINGLPLDITLANLFSSQLSNEPGPAKVIVDISKNGVLSVDLNAPTTSSFEFCNNMLNIYSDFYTTGSINFNVEGFDDEEDEHSNGMSGMKLQGDLYGSYCSVSSGPLAGRDLLQIDRLSTLAARKLAYKIFEDNNKNVEVRVEFGFKKGRSQPIVAKCIIDGVETYLENDFSPNSLLEYIGGRKQTSIHYLNTHVD